jgi:hypothetical protein
MFGFHPLSSCYPSLDNHLFGFMTLPDIPKRYTISASRSDWPELLADWQALLPTGSMPCC